MYIFDFHDHPTAYGPTKSHFSRQITNFKYILHLAIFSFFAMYKNAVRGNREQSSNSPDHGLILKLQILTNFVSLFSIVKI